MVGSWIHEMKLHDRDVQWVSQPLWWRIFYYYYFFFGVWSKSGLKKSIFLLVFYHCNLLQLVTVYCLQLENVVELCGCCTVHVQWLNNMIIIVGDFVCWTLFRFESLTLGQQIHSLICEICIIQNYKYASWEKVCIIVSKKTKALNAISSYNN